jgi:hypothetical protein
VIKVSDRKNRGNKNWRFKYDVIWEKTYGKIPRRRVVIFADGNKRNFDPDNLILVSRGELAVMNHLGLITANRDLTLAGKAAADIKMLIADRKRGVKKRKKSRPGRPHKKEWN